MRYNPEVHHRRSTRLRSWDYSREWGYYVTIVVKDRQCRFGSVVGDSVILADLGKVTDDCWRHIPQHHEHVELDEYVIMPNHVHGIIIIKDSDDMRGDLQNNQSSRRDVQLNVPTVQLNHPTEDGQQLFPSRSKAMGALSPKRGTLSVIVRTFKAAVTTWAEDNGRHDFAWQSRFHDHIIRNEGDLCRIRTYIANNPLLWALDEENRGSRK